QFLEKAEKEINQLKVVVENLKKQLEGQREEIEKEEKALQKEEEKSGELRTNRNHIFDGKPAEEIEMAFQEAISAARTAYDQKQEEKERNETVFTRMSTRNEQIEKELRNLQKEERERATAIKEWLQAYNNKREMNLSLQELKQLLSYDRSWIEEERKEIGRAHV